MNFQTFKISETTNNFYFYFISHVDDPELVLDIVDVCLDEKDKPMNQYIMSIDPDTIKCEKVSVSPCDVINRNLPQDSKCMNISNDYCALIPPPKESRKKKEAKPKVEKTPKEPKQAKPRAKKVQKGVIIDTVGTTITMN